MKAIDVDTLEWFQVKLSDGSTGIYIRKPHVLDLDIIEAEPVRHTENITVIDTDNVKEWKSRIMVCERNSHWGRLYYESDTKRGKWIAQDETYTRWFCSECKSKNHHKRTNYCPNCGAKMDLED